MRIFCSIVLFLAGGIVILPAQTNAGTNGVDAILALVTTNAPPKPKPEPLFKTPRGPLKIESAGPADVDINGHWVTYQDNVRVSDSQMKLMCEWLEANVPLQSSEHVTNIVARTNVVINFIDDKGQKSTATGDKAVYLYQVINGATNETVTLTGNPPSVQEGLSSMTADEIVWNRATGHLSFNGNFKGNFVQETNAPVATNALTLGTNVMSAVTNAPVAQTNTMAVTTNVMTADTNPPAK